MWSTSEMEFYIHGISPGYWLAIQILMNIPIQEQIRFLQIRFKKILYSDFFLSAIPHGQR